MKTGAILAGVGGDILRRISVLYDRNPSICSMYSFSSDKLTDIYLMNSQARFAKKSGMIILGGGVCKHHICNGNYIVRDASILLTLSNVKISMHHFSFNNAAVSMHIPNE